MVIGVFGSVPIAGPPPQSRGGAPPGVLIPSALSPPPAHEVPRMACAGTMPANRPIFPGWDTQAPTFAVPPAAEPVVVNRPATAMPAASSTHSFLIGSPLLGQQRARV